LSVRAYFQISAERAREILRKLEHTLSGWRKAGRARGMTERELDQFSEAFEHPERAAARRAAA
jgi:serine/threonine-protein kinase HipA